VCVCIYVCVCTAATPVRGGEDDAEELGQIEGRILDPKPGSSQWRSVFIQSCCSCATRALQKCYSRTHDYTLLPKKVGA
jgi:hypothetical protein